MLYTVQGKLNTIVTHDEENISTLNQGLKQRRLLHWSLGVLRSSVMNIDALKLMTEVISYTPPKTNFMDAFLL